MEEELQNSEEQNQEDAAMQDMVPVSGMYESWFLEYASYVILDRAVPYIEDGLKPVQRRILHAMKVLDDGRFNKVANIIGSTMQYHPHGDAAIGDAIVKLGQKDLLIDTQGNWGNILTGDSAAAPRYIEARLSKFALAVAFNAKTTEWQLSYDGRKNEPVTLPVKFPLVLAQGVEGIAVGLSTKILPHNFCELIEASIAYLKGRSFKLYPDFASGGMVDISNYNAGKRGGKVRVRASIQEIDKRTLVITDIPYGTTTGSLIDSIIKANDKGKIKIKRIDDNTAKNVEIIVHLPSGISPAIAIDALYAFTQCEVSISPNCCIIIEGKPVFTDVHSVLKRSTDATVALLKWELEIRKQELEEKWHLSSLEKIFIENRIYRDIEECETWEAVIETIDKGLEPFKPQLKREVTREDIVRLTEIKIKRISKYDSFKADELIKGIEEELKQVNYDLEHLVDYAIAYFQNLFQNFGEGRERKTEIKAFDTIEATQVAVANQKLYMNAKEGFIGTSLKKEEFVCECSDIDDIIVFLKDGTMMVTKVADKTFVGKGIIYANVFRKGDDRMVYHLIYEDPKDKRTYVKRFQVLAITRDREYVLTKSKKKGKVHYFTANPNGESEVVSIKLKPLSRLRKTNFEFDFAELDIKGRSAGGNLLAKTPVNRIIQKSQGTSTLGGRKIWYDDAVKRLNTDKIGKYLGSFDGEDRILVLYGDGSYELTNFDLNNRYDSKGEVIEICKLLPETIISAIHQDGKNNTIYVKRFQVETSTLNQKFSYISDEKKSKLIWATTKASPIVNVIYYSKKEGEQEVNLEEFIALKGWKAIGNKLSDKRIRKIELKSFKAYSEQEKKPEKPESSPKDIPMEVVDKRGKDDGTLTLF